MWMVLAVLAIFGLFFLYRPAGPRPDLDGTAVITQVRRLNQLTTVKYTVQKVIGLEEQKQPVGSERILLVMQATVEAGVDLASLRAGQVERRADGAVVIRLPPGKILNVFVDENETKVWDRQKTWWTPWVPYSNELEKKARMEGLESVRKAAIDMGILKQAERNAETSIRSLLTLTGLTNVVIVPGSAS
jgi:hypothetical protein